MDPNVLPVYEPIKYSHDIPVGTSFKHDNPRNEPCLPVGVALLDLPMAERQKYMWQIDPNLRDHPMYKEEKYGARIKKEALDKIQKEEDDKKQKEQDKDDTLQAMAQHIVTLNATINDILKKMNK